jgi:hypothetical protein
MSDSKFLIISLLIHPVRMYGFQYFGSAYEHWFIFVVTKFDHSTTNHALKF